MKTRKDEARKVLQDLVDAAIRCYSFTYGKRSWCHGVLESTVLVRRAKRLLKPKAARKGRG